MLSLVILFSLLSGSTVIFGALISRYFENRVHDKYKKEFIIHSLIAFATGIMIAAISFVLIPKGMENLNIFISVILFLLGGLVFYYLDKLIQKHKTSLPQILAMLLDFIPESIALGALFVYDFKTGILLSIFIALQNLPESFNSYLELKQKGVKTKKALVIFFLLSFVGLIFSMLGYFLLSEYEQITSSLMVFAAGGIMYIIFQDIAPLMQFKKSRLIAIGVNIGFIFGMIGESLI